MQLKEIREEMHYSMSEMSEELRISKSTYQGYESGRRATPPHTMESAFAALQRVKKWDVEWAKKCKPGGILDQIMEKVPYFMSEPCE